MISFIVKNLYSCVTITVDNPKMDSKLDSQNENGQLPVHENNSEPQLLQPNVEGEENFVKKTVIATNHQSVITETPQNANLQENGIEGGNINLLHRREALSRRPSYRKILKDLSSGESNNTKDNPEPVDIHESQEAESLNDDVQTSQMFSTGTNLIQQPTQEIQLSQDVLNTVSMQNSIQAGQNLQEFTMANLSQSQQTLLQQSTDIGQGSLWPGGQVVVQTPAGMQAYQIQQNHPNSTVMLAGRGVPTTMQSASPQQIAEDASRKRESRLMKNRDAAKECRRRKKEYVKCLETRVAVLEHQNKQLIDELKTLKELYVHKQVDTL